MTATVHRPTYQLIEDSILLLEQINAAETDEEAVELLDRQLELEAAMEGKLERLHAVQRRATTEAALLREEERRLAERRRRQEKVVERVKDLARQLLEARRELTGSARVVTPTVTARLQRSAKRLVAPSDPAAWPEAYVIHVPELDRQALKAALEAGAEIEGCSLEQSEHVRWS